MQLCHSFKARSSRFDDPNLIGTSGLVPVMALAERAPDFYRLSHTCVVVGGGGDGLSAVVDGGRNGDRVAADADAGGPEWP